MNPSTAVFQSKEESTQEKEEDTLGSAQRSSVSVLSLAPAMDKAQSFNEAKIERENGDKDVIRSEYLHSLPAEVQAKIPTGKTITGDVIKKQCKDVTVYFLQADLWAHFRQTVTEMVITKKGRKVFPNPTYIICGLDPEKLYNVTLKISSVDNAVYKFIDSQWVATEQKSRMYPTPAPGRDSYLHQFSPNIGAHWMKEPISFSGMKISNNLEAAGTIVLQSMRKYEMSLVISEMQGTMTVHIHQPETKFIAVTQYQNEIVTRLKIEHNPFANGFRNTSRRRKSRKRTVSDGDAENGHHSDEGSSLDLSHQQPEKTVSGAYTEPRASSPHYDNMSASVAKYLDIKRATYKHLNQHYTSSWQTLPEQQNQDCWGRLQQGMQPYNLPDWTSGLLLPQDGNGPSYNYLNRPLHLHNFSYSQLNPLLQAKCLAASNSGNGEASPLCLVKEKKPKDSTRSPLKINESSQQDRERSPELRCPYSKNDRSPRDSGDLEAKRSSGRKPSEYYPCTEMNNVLQNNRETSVTIKKSVSPLSSVPSNWPMDVQLRQNTGSADLAAPPGNNSTASDLSSCSSLYPRPEVTLQNRDLWATTHEVVVSAEGRPMFPFISLRVDHLEPGVSYSMSMELAPDTDFVYEYKDHEWQPCLEAPNSQQRLLYHHPDNAKLGEEWKSGVHFDRLRLSTLKQGKNLLKIQERRQYYPVIYIEASDMSWRYPLRDAVFITVTIDRSPLTRPERNVLQIPSSPGSSGKLPATLLSPSQRKQTNPKKLHYDSYVAAADLPPDHEALDSQPVDLASPSKLYVDADLSSRPRSLNKPGRSYNFLLSDSEEDEGTCTQQTESNGRSKGHVNYFV